MISRIKTWPFVLALVVDDVEDNREVLSGLLQRAGIEVIMANNGIEALQRVSEQLPHIIFMDVRMPVMDGLTAVRQMRERWPEEQIVCVAITASGLLREPSFYRDAGFDDFIGKPFLFETLCRCMARHLAVAFEREPVGEAPESPGPGRSSDVRSVRLPPALRERLLHAAGRNALTQIEAAIAEMRAGDPNLHGLAQLEVERSEWFVEQ